MIDNPTLFVAICMGKYIFPESREKLYKQDSHICKISLPYKIQDISHLEH